MVSVSIIIALTTLAGYLAYKQVMTAAKLSNLQIKHETVLKYVESLEAQKKVASPTTTTRKKIAPKAAVTEVTTTKRGRKPKSK